MEKEHLSAIKYCADLDLLQRKLFLRHLSARVYYSMTVLLPDALSMCNSSLQMYTEVGRVLVDCKIIILSIANKALR